MLFLFCLQKMAIQLSLEAPRGRSSLVDQLDLGFVRRAQLYRLLLPQEVGIWADLHDEWMHITLVSEQAVCVLPLYLALQGARAIISTASPRCATSRGIAMWQRPGVLDLFELR